MTLAGTFGHPGVANAYRHRPPYPDEVFTRLAALLAGPAGRAPDEPASRALDDSVGRALDGPVRVLDLGAGEGALARRLADPRGPVRAGRVDAVEMSPAMVAAGRQRPGGRGRRLRWIVGAAESCPLDGPYMLATAGASLHWMDTRVVLSRVAGALADGGVLAIVEHGPAELPWRDDLVAIIRRHSRSTGYRPDFSIVDALTAEGSFAPAGVAETAPVLFRQPVEDYVEHFFSTASLARELMSPDEAADFGDTVARAVAPWARAGVLEMPIVATLTWGRPVAQPIS